VLLQLECADGQAVDEKAKVEREQGALLKAVRDAAEPVEVPTSR